MSVDDSSQRDSSPRRASLLVVEDDRTFARTLQDTFEDEDWTVLVAATLAAARGLLDRRPDVVVLDQRLPDGGGLQLIDEINAANAAAKTIVVTAHGSVDDAVYALKRGIVDYMTKPVDLESLKLAVLRARDHAWLTQAAAAHQRGGEGRADVVGTSAAATRLAHLVARAATTRAPVLIVGETGVGKTLVAKNIHNLAGDGRPFVAVNCAAIPENLVESELLGVERGAYTGAHQPRQGLFELADHGTLFLDEIGEMSLALQAKLLTVIEDHVVRRVGSSRDRRVDVRVIAATNTDVDANERLRKDLLYRLDVLRIEVPPLRERAVDLPALCDGILSRLAGTRRPKLASGEIERLAAYTWPGNIRELRNVLERSFLLDDPDALVPSSHIARAHPPADDTHDTDEALETIERRHILGCLARAGNARELAAKRLGISPATLRRKLAAWGIR